MPTPETPSEINAFLEPLEKAHAKATKGPWRFVSDCGEVVPPVVAFGVEKPPRMVCRMVVAQTIPSNHPREYEARNNGSWIDASYNAAPQLFALARRAAKAEQALREIATNGRMHNESLASIAKSALADSKEPA